ncbi:MAG: hypothetical protein V9G12_25160 [Microthrixaceae bacterium]
MTKAMADAMTQATSILEPFVAATRGAIPEDAGPLRHPGGCSGPGDMLNLPASTPGSTVSGELWLHNHTGVDLDGVLLSAGPLVSAGGTSLDHTAVSFDPTGVIVLPDRSSRGVLVVVNLPDTITPGTYRGIVVAGGMEDMWMNLVVPILAPR